MFCLIVGKIGCGKSTVSQLLRERGYLVIDTDQLMKDLFAQVELKTAIIAKYGKGAFTDKGTLSIPIIEKCLDSDEDYSWFQNLIEEDYVRVISKFNKNFPVFIETAVISSALFKFKSHIRYIFEIDCNYVKRKDRVIRRYEEKFRKEYGKDGMSESDKDRIDKTEKLQRRWDGAADELRSYYPSIKYKQFVNEDVDDPQKIADQLEYIVTGAVEI